MSVIVLLVGMVMAFASGLGTVSSPAVAHAFKVVSAAISGRVAATASTVMTAVLVVACVLAWRRPDLKLETFLRRTGSSSSIGAQTGTP